MTAKQTAFGGFLWGVAVVGGHLLAGWRGALAAFIGASLATVAHGYEMGRTGAE